MQTEILDFLRQFATVQERTVSVLRQKQTLLLRPDKATLDAIGIEENEVLEQLRQILRRRESILLRAEREGTAADTLQELCERLFPKNSACFQQLEETRQRSQRIRFLALTNWTMTQRSIVHLSHILELIETRGEGKTTYSPQNGKETTSSSGGFVDRVA